MTEEKKHLEDWINDTSNEQQQNENLEYSEREVLEMLESYKIKLSLSSVSESFYCDDVVEYSLERCDKQCGRCRIIHKEYTTSLSKNK